jgi:hypothetical protein
MKIKIIEIVISPTGQTQVETKGFTGNECRDTSRFIENALGKRISEQTTAEFHQHLSDETHQLEGA